MNNRLNTGLPPRETRLQNEISSIQDEIEMLHMLLQRKQKELDGIEQRICDSIHKGNVAA